MALDWEPLAAPLCHVDMTEGPFVGVSPGAQSRARRPKPERSADGDPAWRVLGGLMVSLGGRFAGGGYVGDPGSSNSPLDTIESSCAITQAPRLDVRSIDRRTMGARPEASCVPVVED